MSPSLDKLRAMSASLTTTGGAEMMHLVGLTPEATSLEAAFGGFQPQAEETITRLDLTVARAAFGTHKREEVQFISLGCPHYSLPQLKGVNDFLRGRKINRGVELQVWTAPAVREMARLSGWVQAIEEAGGKVLTSSCPLASDKWPRKAEGLAFDSAKQAHYLLSEGLAFDSAKQAHYLLSETQATVYFSSPEDCLRTAISGRWEGASE